MASASATLPPSGGHSGRLRYANAQDLPSYPSPGLKPGDAAASAAATLGWATTSVFPSPASPHAGPGSLPAQPTGPRSQDAFLAAGRAQRQPKQPASPPSTWVSTAANLAFKTTKTPAPATERSELSAQASNSMQAAKGAMAGPRPRARSSPQTSTDRDPDQPNTAAYALSAATIAHGPSVRAHTVSVGEAGAVPYTTMDRQMFTSNPPVQLEVDEQNRAYVLHASALAMAKRMYDQQQKMIDQSSQAHARSSSFSGHDAASLATPRGQQSPPIMYNSLQEAAYRLAQERLAKLQEEHDRQRGLQDYYGASGTTHRTKLGTIKGKLTRRRSSSDGDLLEDRWRSEQIRKQMSLLNNKLSEVDEDKRTRDRQALLAVAQRNVKVQLQEMDDKVQSGKGGVPQVAMDDWGRKALVAAQARFDAGGHGGDAGKVDLGGGKLMDKSEVDRIAAKNVQPLLDEINLRAEEEKARQAEEKLEEERRKEAAETDRMREAEIQAIHKKLKDQQKDGERARKAEVKRQEKMRKDEARAIKEEEKHKEKEVDSSPDTENNRTSAASRVRALSITFTKRPPRHKSKESIDKPISADDTPTSPTRKVRAWLLSRFPRPRAKSTSTPTAEDQTPPDTTTTKGKGFIGGAALARLHGPNSSTPSVAGLDPQDKGKGKEIAAADSSMHEVALAGRRGDEPGESSTTTTTTPRAATTTTTSPSTPPPPQQNPHHRPLSQVSQVSLASIPTPASAARMSSVSNSSLVSSIGSSGSERFVLARSEPETPSVLAAAPTVVRMGGRGSPFRESRFSEIL